MARSTVTEYPGDDETHVFLSPSSAGGYYHIIAFKSLESLREIVRSEIEIGVYRFVPGEKYSKFGSGKKKSAGFIRYEGEPIVFVGTYGENMLFSSGEETMTIYEYPMCYFSWKILDSGNLLSFTHQSAARIMEMGE